MVVRRNTWKCGKDPKQLCAPKGGTSDSCEMLEINTQLKVELYPHLNPNSNSSKLLFLHHKERLNLLLPRRHFQGTIANQIIVIIYLPYILVEAFIFTKVVNLIDYNYELHLIKRQWQWELRGLSNHGRKAYLCFILISPSASKDC